MITQQNIIQKRHLFNRNSIHKNIQHSKLPIPKGKLSHPYNSCKHINSIQKLNISFHTRTSLNKQTTHCQFKFKEKKFIFLGIYIIILQIHFAPSSSSGREPFFLFSQTKQNWWGRRRKTSAFPPDIRLGVVLAVAPGQDSLSPGTQQTHLTHPVAAATTQQTQPPRKTVAPAFFFSATLGLAPPKFASMLRAAASLLS
jgi:hypothetical protein